MSSVTHLGFPELRGEIHEAARAGYGRWSSQGRDEDLPDATAPAPASG